MNCHINPKELYRPLHSVPNRHNSKRGVVQGKLNPLIFSRNSKAGFSREKVSVSHTPGLIIKVCNSNRPLKFDLVDKVRYKTPDHQPKRPMTSCFIRKNSGGSQNFSALGLEGIKVRCKSISATPPEFKNFPKRKMVKAVIPKVENLQGWSN